jgi:hypothetical protein
MGTVEVQLVAVGVVKGDLVVSAFGVVSPMRVDRGVKRQDQSGERTLTTWACDEILSDPSDASLHCESESARESAGCDVLAA